MPKQSGGGGMGMSKHYKSGTTGRNRRSMKQLNRELNRKAKKRRRKSKMYDSIEELMEEERKK